MAGGIARIFVWADRARGRNALGERSTTERLHEISDVKRFPNETPDLRGAQGCRQHLLAIGACQDHSDLWPSSRCFSNDLRAGSPRDQSDFDKRL